MNSFGYYSAADFLTGTLQNSRVNQVYSLSTYNKDEVVPDYDSQSISVYTGVNAAPSPVRTWVNTSNNSLSTYYAKEFTDLEVQGAAIEIVYQTSLNGAFAKHYIDGVNDVSVSTYGALGGTANVVLPLTNNNVQDIKIVHSGFGDKRGSTLGTPQNIVGSTMASAIQITPNGFPIVTDTWTLTGIDSSTFQLHRGSTGVNQTLDYNTFYASVRGNPADNGIPGFNLTVVNGSSSGNSASFSTTAPVLTIDHFNVYKSFASISSWQTPIMDSGDQTSLWSHIYHEAPFQSMSTYVTKVEVGSVLPVDMTWQTFIPTESAVIDVTPTQYEFGYRKVVTDADQLEGRYCRVTFNMINIQQFIRYPQIFFWNPSTDPAFNLLPPIIQGDKINRFMSSLINVFTQTRQKIQRLKNSMAVSTADQEYLIQIGTSLGFPIRKNESLSNYRNRLADTVMLANAGSTLSSILTTVQAYANSDAVYFVVPNAHTSQWKLGTSILGVSTYLGGKFFQFWTVEVHTPGALPDIVPDIYEKFVQSIMPIGAVSTFIYE